MWVLTILLRIKRVRAGYQREIAGTKTRRISGVWSQETFYWSCQENDLRAAISMPLGRSGNNKPAAIVRRQPPATRSTAIQTATLQWRGIRQTRRKLCIAWAVCRMMQMRQVQNESRRRSAASVDLGSIGASARTQRM